MRALRSRVSTPFFRALLVACIGPFLISTPVYGADVRATIENVPSGEGVVILLVCSEAAYQKTKCEHRRELAARQGRMDIFVADVAPGAWGVFVLHDANQNSKLDFKWWGPPREAYGNSNNPPVRMGPARWRDIVFPLTDAGVDLSITLKGGAQ